MDIAAIFYEIFYRPIFNILILIYDFLPFKDFGLSIIILTVLTRVIFYPLIVKSARSQKELAKLQPRVKEIQDKYKNKEEQTKAIMALYKDRKVNPLAGCTPLLIQMPILIALFSVFKDGLKTEALNNLYYFVPRPEHINTLAFGFLDLTAKTPLLLALAAGLMQFLQAKIMPQPAITSGAKSDSFAMGKVLSMQMKYIFPLVTVYIAYNFPAGLGLYWVAITIVSVMQQYAVNRKLAAEESSE